MSIIMAVSIFSFWISTTAQDLDLDFKNFMSFLDSGSEGAHDPCFHKYYLKKINHHITEASISIINTHAIAKIQLKERNAIGNNWKQIGSAFMLKEEIIIIVFSSLKKTL